MVKIKFPDQETHDRAVGFLGSSHTIRVLRSGELVVPEAALAELAGKNLSFMVVGNTANGKKVALPKQVPLMVSITFADRQVKRRAIGYLAGRFSARVLRSGELIVPEPAVEALAAENYSFTVQGPATYEQMAPVRGPVARPVQRRVARARGNDR